MMFGTRFFKSGNFAQAIAIGLVALGLWSCGAGPDGPSRHDLTGTITYDGKPIPGGVVSFAPDATQGNSGPGSTGTILYGVYQTRPGKGIVGGAYVVTIDGYIENTDLPLFPQYVVKAVLPDKGGVWDCEVPVTKAKK